MRRSDKGQATVEFAVCLPLIMLLCLALVQVALVGMRQVQVIHATREGARRAIVTDDNGDITASVEQALGRPNTEVRITRLESGSKAAVSVEHQMNTDVPLVGPLIPDVTLKARFIVRTERR